ncbi:MAG: hypothetical protein ABI304_05965 [Rudaea sp.]
MLVLCCSVGCQPSTDGSKLPPRQLVAQKACDAIASRVDLYPSASALFLKSYDADDQGNQDPSLETAAFSYDNALAVIALIACDKLPQAQRVGEALRRAAMSDTRLRKAYRAGVVKDGVLPNGWWDKAESRWVEDPHQIGTPTGDVAWVGLALMALDKATGEPRWREAAVHLAQWIEHNAAGKNGSAGFTGGVDGFDADPKKLDWKSTEHNIDVSALFNWMADKATSGPWKQRAEDAWRFVDTQWDAKTGHFFVGTMPDGAENIDTSGLDAQLWPLLLPDAPPEWRRAISYVEQNHGVAGGFDFNTDRDGLWLEGTAQAALVYEVLGRDSEANKLFMTIAKQFSASGYLYATREARISTGLALGPESKSADFYYYRRPHLGATAWAVLAALKWNPFRAHGK